MSRLEPVPVGQLQQMLLTVTGQIGTTVQNGAGAWLTKQAALTSHSSLISDKEAGVGRMRCRFPLAAPLPRKLKLMKCLIVRCQLSATN